MKEKTKNLIEIIIQGAILILIFVPGMYQEEWWKVDSDALSKTLGGWTNKRTIIVSYWTKNMYLSDITTVLLWALIIIMCVAFVMYLIQYIGTKEKLNSKILRLLLIIELVLFIVPTFFTHTSKGEVGNYTSYYSYSPYVLFPITVALMVLLIFLPLIGKKKTSKQDFVEDSTGKKVTNLTADELRKYKSLYDEGIITSEEYEKKKNQILNNR